MKKTITTMVLIAFAVTCLTGCSSNDITSGSATTEYTDDITTAEKTISFTEETTIPTTDQVEDFDINVLGQLYQLKTKPVVSSVRMRVTGDTSQYNNQSPAPIGIRCVFEVDDYIFVKLICPEKEDDLYVKIFPHKENSSYYKDLTYSIDEIEAITTHFQYEDDGTLNAFFKPGSTPGYFDVVIIKVNKPVALVMIKLYEKGEIDETGKTPYQLMNEENKSLSDASSSSSTIPTE